MNKNKTIQTELDKIPNKIKKMYAIKISKDHLLIHAPSYINLHYDKKFNIEIDEFTTTIKNNLVSVTLWDDVFVMHTTIFY